MTARAQSEGRLATLLGYDCWSLLESADIARVAWCGADGVAMRPVNYTVAAGAVWFRTMAGSAVAQECDGQRVVVEVDQIDSATRAGWSVLVTGTAELVDAADLPQLLVDLEAWPTGDRDVFVRVNGEQVTGRRLYGTGGR